MGDILTKPSFAISLVLLSSLHTHIVYLKLIERAIIREKNLLLELRSTLSLYIQTLVDQIKLETMTLSCITIYSKTSALNLTVI
jgi:hypothetical protein